MDLTAVSCEDVRWMEMSEGL